MVEREANHAVKAFEIVVIDTDIGNNESSAK